MVNSEAASTLTLELRLARGASRVLAVALVGAPRRNQPIGGLCSNLYVTPGIQLPLGLTNAIGDVPRRAPPLPYNPSLFGQTVYPRGPARIRPKPVGRSPQPRVKHSASRTRNASCTTSAPMAVAS